MNLVTVLIPVYNSQEFLAQTFQGLLNQTYKDFDLIVLDDGSTDQSPDIIQEFSTQFKNFKVIQNSGNQGVSKARNSLISAATTKYIVWQDADDISMPDRLEKQIAFMESNPNVGICGGWLQFFDGQNDLTIRTYAPDDQSLRKTIFQYSPVSQGASIIRREVFDKVGEYNTNLQQAEDLEMSFRIGKFYQFANLQQVVSRCRFHPHSISTKKMRDNIIATLKVRSFGKHLGYRMTVRDQLAFAATWLVQFLPPQLVFQLFNLLRT